MVSSTALARELVLSGYSIAASVPCSFLAPLLSALDADPGILHISATSEAEAVGIASGALLAEKKCVLLMQNSGFLDALNPISSLLLPFELSTLIIVSGRGARDIQDEPQHRTTGMTFETIATSVGLGFAWLRDVGETPDLAFIENWMTTNRRPFVLAVGKSMLDTDAPIVPQPTLGAVGAGTLLETQLHHSYRGARHEFIERLPDIVEENTVVVATTGYTGRELEATSTRLRNIALVGSMGCASAVGLGIAIAREVPIVVLDGDGACLMRLGNLATIAACAPRSFAHVVFNNGVYESTGGQRRINSSFPFAAVAAAAGYTQCLRTSSLQEGVEFLLGVRGACAGPVLLELVIEPGTVDQLPRPSITPCASAQRLQQALRSGP